MSSSSELRLGTRGSQLALWQARAVAAAIAASGGPPCRLEIVRTSGDQLQEAPLSQVGGKRLFVKEIEDALIRGEIDLAVHSSKDMPAVQPDGLAIAAVLPRENPLDAIVLPQARARTVTSVQDLVAALGQEPRIGTSSVRRVSQLTRLFTGARFEPVRGNLDTRLGKLDAGTHDALVLAAAGLNRLGFASRISLALPVTACVPSPGQGIVAVQIRSDDEKTRRIVEKINDSASSAALTAERALVEALGGGCQTPIGALASPTAGNGLKLVAVVVTPDGGRALHATDTGSSSEAAALGARVARQLLDDGAGAILEEARRVPGSVAGLQP
ncbi:MAG: hydroxymethylbilane synthase [Vicinamibacterales bacterium]